MRTVSCDAPPASSPALTRSQRIRTREASLPASTLRERSPDISRVNRRTASFVRSAAGTITTFESPGTGTGKRFAHSAFAFEESEGHVTSFHKRGEQRAEARNVGFLVHTRRFLDLDGMKVALQSGLKDLVLDSGPVHLVRAHQGGSSISRLESLRRGQASSGTLPLRSIPPEPSPGSYRDSGGVYLGIRRTSTGTITTFSVTGAGTGNLREPSRPASTPRARSLDGTASRVGVSHGFVRSKTGTITNVRSCRFRGPPLFLALTQRGRSRVCWPVGGERCPDTSGDPYVFVRDANGTVTSSLLARCGSTCLFMGINTPPETLPVRVTRDLSSMCVSRLFVYAVKSAE